MKYLNKQFLTGIVVMVLMLTSGALAQERPLSYDQMEKVQDSIERLYVDIYAVIESHPDLLYTYEYEKGELRDVLITGIEDEVTASSFKQDLIELDELKRELFNVSNRMGIYYVAEKEAQPDIGYDAFYENLHSAINYPEEAAEHGLEGTIFVKFVVDHNGDISNIQSASTLDSPDNWMIKEMITEAEKAVAQTSGDWEPATIGGIPVAHWLVIPVQFTLKEEYYRPIGTHPGPGGISG